MNALSGSNRDIALSFLQKCFEGSMDAALAMMAEDATWWVLGNPEKVKLSGTRDMPRIRRYLKNVRLGFPDGLRVEFTGVTAEGDRVALEAVSSARMGDGRPYENHYHFLVQVRDGRVVQVREYLDTQSVYELQLTLQPPAS